MTSLKTTVLIVITLIFVGSSPGDTWHTEIVDSEGDEGRYSSLAIDSNDKVHISYYRTLYNQLKYAFHDGASWDISIIKDYSFGHTSIAVDGNDYPHISYNRSGEGWSHCEYVQYDGTYWNFTTVDPYNAGYYTSIALDGDNYPHISYFDWAFVRLWYAYFDGASWHKSVVDENGYVGEYTSLALESIGDNNPHISYYDHTNKNLNHALYNGTNWIISPVDITGDVGKYTSIALDSNNYPHISYHDYSNKDLKYARWNGSSWETSAVDTQGDVGTMTSIALDSDDHPHISYLSNTECDLKYAYWNGTSWEITTVDNSTGPTYSGGTTSIAFDSNEQPHISYYNSTNDDLMYAYYGPTGIEGDEPSDNPVQLLGAYPNPSCGSIEIRFILTSSSSVDLQVFDLSGRMVNSASSEFGQGQNCFIVNNLTSGMYLAQLRSGDFNTIERFLIID